MGEWMAETCSRKVVIKWRIVLGCCVVWIGFCLCGLGCISVDWVVFVWIGCVCVDWLCLCGLGCVRVEWAVFMWSGLFCADCSVFMYIGLCWCGLALLVWVGLCTCGLGRFCVDWVVFVWIGLCLFGLGCVRVDGVGLVWFGLCSCGMVCYWLTNDFSQNCCVKTCRLYFLVQFRTEWKNVQWFRSVFQTAAVSVWSAVCSRQQLLVSGLHIFSPVDLRVTTECSA